MRSVPAAILAEVEELRAQLKLCKKVTKIDMTGQFVAKLNWDEVLCLGRKSTLEWDNRTFQFYPSDDRCIILSEGLRPKSVAKMLKVPALIIQERIDALIIEARSIEDRLAHLRRLIDNCQ